MADSVEQRSSGSGEGSPGPVTSPAQRPVPQFPFAAIFIVFAAFAMVQAFTLRAAWKQRVQLRATQAELRKLMPLAQQVNQLAEQVGQDLISLSSNSAEARKILTEFNIKTNRSAPAPK
jgi:hypothetical protein